MRKYDIRDIAECSPIILDCLQPEKGNCLSHAVCDDSVALMPLIQINRALSSVDGDTAGRSGHDTDDGGCPAGLLGYLPWCLYWPRSLHGMTHCLANIKGPSLNILTRVIMNDGGLCDVRISVTLPATHARMEIHPTVIGLRASVGVSAASSDWLGVLGPEDGPPGGIWIGFIRRTVEQGQSIIAVTVTGSLESLALSGRRDADGICRPSALREYGDAAWNLPLLCRTDGVAMDAAGFSMVDNRAGVTFGVELYMPWNAPEMATDLSARGTVPLCDVQDVFGMCGRRRGATESHILQGRDARSVRVLVMGTMTPTPEGPLGNAGPRVTHVSGITDDSCAMLRPPSDVSGIIDNLCARLRPPSERPLGNAGPQVTHVSGITDDSYARLRPPSERPISNAGPQVTHVSGIIQ